MPLSASKHIALINAVLTTLLFSIVYIILFLSFFTFKPLPLLVFIPLIFVFAYFISNLLFDQYIKEKLKVIYKTIGLLKPENAPPLLKKRKTDELEIVNSVVLKWSEEKKKEIEDSIEGLKNIIKKSSNYISRPLFKKILQTASWFYPKLNCKVSLYEVIENFYLGMIGTTEKIDDNRLSEMKNLIGRVYSKNELFFLSSVK